MSQIIRAAVIGHPIGHTLSPFLHRRLFALSELEADYRAIDVPDLRAAMPALRELDCFNVTIPHKIGILPFLDEIDEDARVCGSVNTVLRCEDALFGSTTDGPGCRKALQTHGLDFAGEMALLGTGGAARAIGFEIARNATEGQLIVVGREQSRDKARALADELRNCPGRPYRSELEICHAGYGEIEEFCSEGGAFDLLLNATSAGMWPDLDGCPVSARVLGCCDAVFDAVYNPLETTLLRLAREQGKQTVGGLEMLVYQAAAAHEIWYDADFRREDLLRLCEDAALELKQHFKEG